MVLKKWKVKREKYERGGAIAWEITAKMNV
jgi:hypothetical protein